MKPRHLRMAVAGGVLLAVGGIAALVFNAFQSNMVFFYSPTQVGAKEAPIDRTFRIGGLVKEGSLQRQADGVTIAFIVTDMAKDITVNYKGILPDLFKEGKGVVAQGKMTTADTFTANEVLAKHDENYMPPEAAKAVGDAQARAAEADKPKASY